MPKAGLNQLFVCCALAFAGLTAYSATNNPSAFPWNQIGAKAGADYKGDGLAVTPTDVGARLHCVFQRLDAEATPKGLWLTSTALNSAPDRFRVMAVSIGRRPTVVPAPPEPREASWSAAVPCRFSTEDHQTSSTTGSETLPASGTVSLENQTVRFTRPGLTEEYTVSMDGLRQDFIIPEPPEPREASWSTPDLWRFSASPATTDEDPSPSPPLGEREGVRGTKVPLQRQFHGDLLLTLSITGARVEPAPDGATLILEHSGRRITYNRLRVTDATGKELSARVEVPQDSALRTPHSAFALSITIDDTDALYPLRIDPTFSDANWLSMGGLPGTDNEIRAAVVDGSGNLYIGGNFHIVGTIFAANVAQWNGTNWLALGLGISGESGFPPVSALAVSGTTLYVGGNFSEAGGIAANSVAQWNGTNWSALGSGVTGDVNAVAVLGGSLYVGGSFFTGVGGTENIARWNGTNWFSLGSGVNSTVYALSVSGSNLYVGGGFTVTGTTNVNNIALWSGTTWSPLGSGISGTVYALAVSGSTVYAGGLFTNAGGVSANCIAQWDGTNWSPLGSGMNTTVYSLATAGNILFAAGGFTNAGGSAVNCVAQWNGSSWSNPGSGISGAAGRILIGPYIYALAASGSNLYAGGYFTMAGSAAANSIAEWNGTNWSALAPGMNNIVEALAVSGNTVYVGGAFTSAGTSTADYIAQWNGTTWSPLGSGLNSNVFALAASGSNLFAGGLFTTAGGIPAKYVAQWNGSNWSALGSGMSGGLNRVIGLAISGSTLYAAGSFTNAGGIAASNIAQWNGSNWSPLGSGMNGLVGALAVAGSTLYAGGAFTNAGGGGANYVAQWDGSNWSPLGAGMNATVEALAVSSGTLYAGGTFTNAGVGGANYVAQWNGSAWYPLGSGMNNTVSAFAVSGGLLYAGGVFSTAGGNSAGFIAQWNGNNWSAMGSGVGGSPTVNFVSALAATGNILYAGGEFTTAGTNVSAYLAEAILPVSLCILTTDGNFGFTNGLFGFDISGPPGSNVVIQSSPDLTNWTSLQTNQVNTNGLLYFSDAQSPSNSQRFYQAILP